MTIDNQESRAIGTVASVNVGEPRQVEWAGRIVTTAIWKQPTVDRVPVNHDNLAGDAQADLRVHGGPDKAVYAYASEDYRWWESELDSHLEPGTFGENLTTAGVDLARVVIGERWSVGTTELEVAQTRQPCFKLGIRMGDAAFVERFDGARRFGVYLRINETGELRVGDEIRSPTLLIRVSQPKSGDFSRSMQCPRGRRCGFADSSAELHGRGSSCRSVFLGWLRSTQLTCTTGETNFSVAKLKAMAYFRCNNALERALLTLRRD
jgi:MOSC domain-containing protein YiiM